MRRLLPIVALAALPWSAPLLAPPAAAQPLPPKRGAPPPVPDKPARPPPRSQSLDDLFARLAAAQDETEAKGVERLIERRWARSGSDTADLLMARAGEAIAAKELPLAIELLDRVLALEPNWAEGWYRRATAFHMLDDPVRALADLQQALAREPRHFNAWAGLGHIQMASDNKRQALLAYRKALALHPHLQRMKDVVDKLTPEIDGRDI